MTRRKRERIWSMYWTDDRAAKFTTEAGDNWARTSYQCPARRESDEVVCPICGLRWSLAEDRPECPAGVPLRECPR